MYDIIIEKQLIIQVVLFILFKVDIRLSKYFSISKFKIE